MSFFQGISGIGVIGGMGFGLIANSQGFPIDSHFPIVGLAMLTPLIFTPISFLPYETIEDGQHTDFKLSNALVLLAFTNFVLILAISQFLSWSGMMLRDEFHFTVVLATLEAFGFILTETAVRVFCFTILYVSL